MINDPNVQMAKEIINAEQIRSPETYDGSGRTQSSIREESWRARERSTGVQSGRQGKRQTISAARQQEEESKEAQKAQ